MKNQKKKEEETQVKNEYLSFLLGQEKYAIDILKVQEIRSYETPTIIAQSPDFIKGVINLRGLIVPIVDLRIKFGFLEVTYTPFTIVIILHIGNRHVGIVVDGVTDVVLLAVDEITEAPDFSGAFDTKYIQGLASYQDELLIVVDIENLMNSKAMTLLETLTDDQIPLA